LVQNRLETTRHLREGLLPYEIARRTEQPLSNVIQHILHQLGQGELRPAEIILGFNQSLGDRLDEGFREHRNDGYETFEKHAVALGCTPEEARLYHDVRRSPGLRGDVYVHISDLEVGLHKLIREVLESHFGSGETGWWRQGVPVQVRKACVQYREDDPDPVPDPYRYTTFIQLSSIINENWSIFQYVFQGHTRKQLEGLLRHLNQLRNAVMHPVKAKQWGPEELRAVMAMQEIVRQITPAQARPNATSPGDTPPTGLPTEPAGNEKEPSGSGGQPKKKASN
jgi:hypothetical protein